MAPFFSVIVPVLDGGEVFSRCLEALYTSEFDSFEVLVVDDGSTDGSGDVARALGAQVLRTEGRVGPAAARNLAATVARGDYLLFIDADCEVTPRTLAAMAAVFTEDPDLAAAFGSYDDSPAAASLVSQYKNLQHHWVHQNGSEEASTFWSGCGAVRRRVFEELGGFDAALFSRPSIEDIELGWRLREAGYRIRLQKDVTVKHHKRWRLWSLIRTDLFDRGVPWTRLMLRNGSLASELNLGIEGRASGAIAGLLAASLMGAVLLWSGLIWVSAVLALSLLALNRGFYNFLLRRRGLGFLLAALPLHWLYYLYSDLAFVLGYGAHVATGGRLSRGDRVLPRP
jgi:GT2 family glycosyltransferase